MPRQIDQVLMAVNNCHLIFPLLFVLLITLIFLLHIQLYLKTTFTKCNVSVSKKCFKNFWEWWITSNTVISKILRHQTGLCVGNLVPHFQHIVTVCQL